MEALSIVTRSKQFSWLLNVELSLCPLVKDSTVRECILMGGCIIIVII